MKQSKRKQNKRSASIKSRIILAFLLFASIQTVAFLPILSTMGVFKSVFDHSYSNFNKQVINRADSISKSLLETKDSFLPFAQSVNEIAKTADTRDTLAQSAKVLTRFLDVSKDVTGVFVFLENDTNIRDALYIREDEFEVNARKSDTKSYILGPKEIADDNGYSISADWQEKQNFLSIPGDGSADFYFEPIRVLEKSGQNSLDVYYFSKPFSLFSNDYKFITMTVPIVDKNGVPVGVCGFEIHAANMKKMLPHTELSEFGSAYVLSGKNLVDGAKDGNINGNIDNAFFSEHLVQTPLKSIFDIARLRNETFEAHESFCIKSEVELYDDDSPFKDEKLYLYGVVHSKALDAYPNNVINSIYLTQIVIFLISAVLIIVVARWITKPILALSDEVAGIDPTEAFSLSRTGIKEIDYLANELEILSNLTIATASKLETTIDMTGVSIGSFEIAGEQVLITGSLPRILGLPQSARKIPYATWLKFENFMEPTKYEDVYRVSRDDDDTVLWLRKKTSGNGHDTSGVIMDATEEILKLEKVEYERDFDLLTQIPNRRAFFTRLNEGLNNNEYTNGAFIMLDLDNLKYVNDNFGHEIGDKYLVMMADALKEIEEFGALISRMAGDEFTIFFPYDGDYLAAKNQISILLDLCRRKKFLLPDNNVQYLRFSAGIAWYPKDADDADALLKYADFAMYAVKHSTKGTSREFNRDEYNAKMRLLSKIDSFNILMETKELRHKFQPIVGVDTGEIIGYEAFMRTDINGLTMPFDILKIAATHSKLDEIELLSLTKALETVQVDENNVFANKCIFFNTTPTVSINYNEMQKLHKKYPDCFTNLVMEVSFEQGMTIDEERLAYLQRLGCKVSIDNVNDIRKFDDVMRTLLPNYVKIGMKLVRGIEKSNEKRRRVSQIMKCAKKYNADVIATGVETEREMETLKSLGVSYMQGYYIARPAYNPVMVEQN